MQNVPHGDHIGLGQVVFQEVACHHGNTPTHARRVDLLLRMRRYRRQVEGAKGQVRVALGDDARQQAQGTADVADCLVAGEVELLRELHEVAGLYAAHRLEKFAQRGLVRIELLEYRLAVDPHLVLRLPGPERRSQMVPEAEQPRIQHLRHAADVSRTGLVGRNAPVSGVFL